MPTGQTDGHHVNFAVDVVPTEVAVKYGGRPQVACGKCILNYTTVRKMAMSASSRLLELAKALTGLRVVVGTIE